MRWVLLITLFTIACGAREIDSKDARLSSATGRLTYEGKPFTGVLVSRNVDAVERKSYREGIEDGMYTLHATHGVLLEERLMRNGIKHGMHRKWHENGKPFVTQEFDNGKNVGEFVVTLADGKPSEYKRFTSEGQILVHKLWRASGQIYINQSFDVDSQPNGAGLPGSKLCNSVKTNGAREKS